MRRVYDDRVVDPPPLARDNKAMLERLERIERLILALEIRIMATLADVITALNDNTNAVGARIDTLIAEIAALQAAGQPVTADQLASLQAISDHLKQLGANPTNPIPPAFPAGSPDAAAHPAAAAEGPHVAPTALGNDVPGVTVAPPTSTTP